MLGKTLLFVLALPTLACERAPTAESVVLELAAKAPGGYVKGQTWLDSCRGEGGSGERCYWFHRRVNRPAMCACRSATFTRTWSPLTNARR